MRLHEYFETIMLLLSQTTKQNLFSVTKPSDIFAHGIFFLRLNFDQSFFSTLLHAVNANIENITLATTYLNRWVYFGCWNSQHHIQTIHPTENFISINLLQLFCVITWDQKNQSSKTRPFLSFTCQTYRVRVNHTITHNLTK